MLKERKPKTEEGFPVNFLQCPRDNETVKSIISKIDYSNALVPNCTSELLEKTCDEALLYGFAAVAVFPSCIEYVAKRLQNSKVHAQIATGFPAATI